MGQTQPKPQMRQIVQTNSTNMCPNDITCKNFNFASQKFECPNATCSSISGCSCGTECTEFKGVCCKKIIKNKNGQDICFEDSSVVVPISPAPTRKPCNISDKILTNNGITIKITGKQLCDWKNVSCNDRTVSSSTVSVRIPGSLICSFNN
jgi:hypothetical protein